MKVITQKEWYHVGTMNLHQKAKNSYEGHCLSVSQCPEEWTSIAQLGGGETFRLYKEDGQFLDAHALTEDQWNVIRAWGVENGYLKEQEVFLYLFGDEDGETCMMELYSRREWEVESGWDDSEEDEQKDLEENGLRIEQRLIATDALKDAECWTQKSCPSFVTEDLLLVRYADEEMDVDGVFWNEELDVGRLSAPRAGILQRRLDQWLVKMTEEAYPMLKMVTQSTWYHVGSMDMGKKEDNPREGLTLSVSRYPQEWATSEGLVGETYRLSREGATFLDALSLTEENWLAIKQWGINRGYLAEQDVLVYTYEEEGKVSSEEYFERKEWEGDYPFGDIEALTLVPRLLATSSLLEKEGWWNEQSLSSVSETLLLVRYADEVLDVDGISWGEGSPLPRAVILNSKLSQWEVQKEQKTTN